VFTRLNTSLDVLVDANPECRIASMFATLADALMTIVDAVEDEIPHGTWDVDPFVEHNDASCCSQSVTVLEVFTK
jgi:hypothetical protein